MYVRTGGYQIAGTGQYQPERIAACRHSDRLSHLLGNTIILFIHHI